MLAPAQVSPAFLRSNYRVFVHSFSLEDIILVFTTSVTLKIQWHKSRCLSKGTKNQTLGFYQSIYFAYLALGRCHELLFKYISNCFHKNHHNVLPQPLWCKKISLHNSLPFPSHFFSSHSSSKVKVTFSCLVTHYTTVGYVETRFFVNFVKSL